MQRGLCHGLLGLFLRLDLLQEVIPGLVDPDGVDHIVPAGEAGGGLLGLLPALTDLPLPWTRACWHPLHPVRGEPPR